VTYPPEFAEWTFSSDFADPATEVFDAESLDRIGYFARPLICRPGVLIQLAGGFGGEVARCDVDLSGDLAVVRVLVRLDDRTGFWQYRRAMELPLDDPEPE
jgi:hypothetical protein